MDERDREGMGFFAALFDFSFTKFVSESLVQIAYVLVLVLALIAIVFTVVSGFADSIWLGIWSLIFSPVVFIVVLTLARVWLEFVVVVFRIADHARTIAENTEK
jgi:hypothetical protein